MSIITLPKDIIICVIQYCGLESIKLSHVSSWLRTVHEAYVKETIKHLDQFNDLYKNVACECSNGDFILACRWLRRLRLDVTLDAILCSHYAVKVGGFTALYKAMRANVVDYISIDHNMVIINQAVTLAALRGHTINVPPALRSNAADHYLDSSLYPHTENDNDHRTRNVSGSSKVSKKQYSTDPPLILCLSYPLTGITDQQRIAALQLLIKLCAGVFAYALEHSSFKILDALRELKCEYRSECGCAAIRSKNVHNVWWLLVRGYHVDWNTVAKAAGYWELEDLKVLFALTRANVETAMIFAAYHGRVGVLRWIETAFLPTVNYPYNADRMHSDAILYAVLACRRNTMNYLVVEKKYSIDKSICEHIHKREPTLCGKKRQDIFAWLRSNNCYCGGAFHK